MLSVEQLPSKYFVTADNSISKEYFEYGTYRGRYGLEDIRKYAGDLDCVMIHDAGQAPELFRLGKYYEANLRLLPERIRHIHGSAEPAVLAGMDIAMIPGDEKNFKITTKADLERFEKTAGLCREKE